MHYLFSLYAFIFGCLVGSFLNVVIIRLPEKIRFGLDRSKCPQCGNQLKWYHNIPVFSFLFLRGKCGFCKGTISWRYPLIELLTGLIAYGLFPDAINPFSLGLFLFYFFIACIFICHFFIDLDHHLLLDSLNLYLLALVLSYSLIMNSWTHWLIGGTIGFGTPLLVTWLFYKIRGQIGLGGGDIKLYGILGLYLGPVGIVFSIFLSCLLGSIVGLILIASGKMQKDKPMPFGPAILVVASVQIFFPDQAKWLQDLFI